MEVKDINNPIDLINWFGDDWEKRWPILVFVVVFFASMTSFLYFGISAPAHYTFISSSCFANSVFGLYHCKTLIKLREVCELSAFDVLYITNG